MIKTFPLRYAPGRESQNNPGHLTDIDGFAPLQRGAYSSVYLSGVPYSQSTATLVQSFRQIDDTVRLLSFRQTDVVEFSDLYNAATKTTIGSGFTSGTWDAANWGDIIICVNGPSGNAPQKTTTALESLSALAGSPPKASCIASTLNFVMLANTENSADEVYWSALQNPLDWTADIATECGYLRLVDTPGPIVALVAYGDKFYAFKKSGVYVGSYIGPPYTFEWRLLSSRVGIVSRQAHAEVDAALYFVDKTGVYRTDGNSLQNVSGDLPAGLFLDDPSQIDNDYPTNIALSCAADDYEGVLWIARGVKDVNSKYNCDMYGYNVRSDLWSKVTLTDHDTGSSVPPTACRFTYADILKTYGDANVYVVCNNASGSLTGIANLEYPQTWSGLNVGSMTTVPVGSVERSYTLTRVYLIPSTTQTGIENCWETCTVSGMTVPNGSTGAESVPATWNSEFQSFDLALNSRYHQAVVTGLVTNTCIIGSIGFEYAPQGSR